MGLYILNSVVVLVSVQSVQAHLVPPVYFMRFDGAPKIFSVRAFKNVTLLFSVCILL